MEYDDYKLYFSPQQLSITNITSLPSCHMALRKKQAWVVKFLKINYIFQQLKSKSAAKEILSQCENHKKINKDMN